MGPSPWGGNSPSIIIPESVWVGEGGADRVITLVEVELHGPSY
jgi:hypothetical protein